MGEAPQVVLDEIVLEPLGSANRPVLESLWQLYLHDLSEFRGSVPGVDGTFRRDRVAAYASEPGRAGYVVRWRDTTLGFALVRGLHDDRRLMGEFFVVRAVRGQGVGYAVARRVIQAHPGAWDIPFQEENPVAARFWRRFATDLVGDAWTQERRPVPDKPWIPDDVWLQLTAR